MVTKLITNPKKYIDFGAGIGTLSLLLKKRIGHPPICIETDETNINYLKKRKLETFDSISKVKEQVNFIFSSNVLEHIYDDESVLIEMNKKLKPMGLLYLYLPANMSLWSELDEAVGHFRRYSKKEIIKKLDNANFRIKNIFFADSLGFFATFAIKVFGHRTQNGLGSVKSLKFYDKYLFPISKLIDSIGFKYFIGKNIVVLAQKK